LTGAGVLYFAEWTDWQTAYRIMAAVMALCVLVTLWIPEPQHAAEADTDTAAAGSGTVGWLQHAIIGPFADFFQRNGRRGLLILGLIVVYKLSDITMGVMANPFYFYLGFTKPQIAEVTKIYGFIMTILGTSLGGVLVMRFGMWRPLFLGAFLVMVTNLLFATLAYVKPSLWFLAAVVSADNLSGGIAAAVFIAYLSSLTNTAYTATQYALFSSLMTLPAKIIGAGSGMIVQQYGYGVFFIYAGMLGLPAVVLVWWLMRRQLQPLLNQA
jgi:MFS transporter, PAT family, beta-lactamase induction signal transducer AmpG